MKVTASCLLENNCYGFIYIDKYKDDPYVESKKIITVSLTDCEFDFKFGIVCIYSTKSNNKEISKVFRINSSISLYDDP